MKTAVSIPNQTFEAAEQLAKRLGLSRSELYARALKSFIADHDDDQITKRLDEVYGEDNGELSPTLARVARHLLRNNQ